MGRLANNLHAWRVARARPSLGGQMLHATGGEVSTQGEFDKYSEVLWMPQWLVQQTTIDARRQSGTLPQLDAQEICLGRRRGADRASISLITTGLVKYSDKGKDVSFCRVLDEWSSRIEKGVGLAASGRVSQ